MFSCLFLHLPCHPLSLSLSLSSSPRAGVPPQKPVDAPEIDVITPSSSHPLFLSSSGISQSRSIDGETSPRVRGRPPLYKQAHVRTSSHGGRRYISGPADERGVQLPSTLLRAAIGPSDHTDLRLSGSSSLPGSSSGPASLPRPTRETRGASVKRTPHLGEFAAFDRK